MPLTFVRTALAGAILALALVCGASSAHAQAFRYQVTAEGKRPLLRIQAQQDLEDLKITLTTAQGKTFKFSRARLARGATASFEIGTKKPGQVSYSGVVSGRVRGKGPFSEKIRFEAGRGAKLSVEYDRDHLDLDKCVLEFRPSHPVVKAELVVFGEDGKELGKGAATYDGKARPGWLAIRWAQKKREARVMKMHLRVTGAGGAVLRVDLVPWSVAIDHEELNFPTGSAVIEKTETHKLDDSLVRIREVIGRSSKYIKMKLYIAGHTDTVGSSSDNRKLSLARARAIAGYFRKKGIRIPIAFAGYGEEVLRAKTGNNTENAANRRVDYVLGPADGAPPFSGGYTKAGARWRKLR